MRIFKNCIDGKFFEIFSLLLPRSMQQDGSIELSFVSFGSVGSSEVECYVKKNSSFYFKTGKSSQQSEKSGISKLVNKN